jgi:hypothetical protein
MDGARPADLGGGGDALIGAGGGLQIADCEDERQARVLTGFLHHLAVRRFGEAGARSHTPESYRHLRQRKVSSAVLFWAERE